MTKNNQNIAKIDVKGFQDLCNHFAELEKENKQLKQDNKVLGHELTYFKEYAADLEEDVNNLKANCRKLTSENMSLKSEIKDMKFTRNYLTGEEAGKAFARELLGKPMTREELAIEAAENCYVPYNGDDF